jgi:hypothetical protein
MASIAWRNPMWASEISSYTPERPRDFSARRNAAASPLHSASSTSSKADWSRAIAMFLSVVMLGRFTVVVTVVVKIVVN